MSRHQTFQRIAVILFVVAFLADAINVDELLGLNSFQRDDDSGTTEQTASFLTNATTNLPGSLSFSSVNPTAHKSKLELVDVDSPSLEAAYVSRDEISPIITNTETIETPVSVHAGLSFYSLCKLQI